MDTIRLKIPYQLPENSVFFSERIHKKVLQLKHINGSRFVWTNNTWRKERQQQGIYTPKYWIEQDFINPNKTYLYFEGSVAKLLGGENITSLTTEQFDEAVRRIVSFFNEIGINYIFTAQIENAYPTLIAIGKNINVTSLCSSEFAILTLKPFDYKAHAKHRYIDFSDQKAAGDEVIFNIPSESIKAYSKNNELRNNASSAQEKEIAQLLQDQAFYIDGKKATEIVRIEATYKTPRKIKQKFSPYLKRKSPTFKNLFSQDLWEKVLTEEVKIIFDHPLQKMLFLALESQPVIDAFLDEYYKHIQTKDTIRGILASLQQRGLAGTRKDYLERYKSRQTWYNYLKRLERLQRHFDWKALNTLSNVTIHSFILKQFGITSRSQIELELSFKNHTSKNIDAKQRITRSRYD